MNASDDQPASAAQIRYVKALFRKSKMYYQFQDDEALAIEVLKRTGFDLKNLNHGQVQAIVAQLSPVADKASRRTFGTWGRKFRS